MLVVDKKLCRGCRICENKCPTGAIKVFKGKAKINNSLCKNCLLCMSVCPVSAIKKIKDTGTKNRHQELSSQIKDMRAQLDEIYRRISTGSNKR